MELNFKTKSPQPKPVLFFTTGIAVLNPVGFQENKSQIFLIGYSNIVWKWPRVPTLYVI